MQNPVPLTATPDQMAAIQNRLVLERRFKNGVNWFYWIAGLSIVNSVAYLSGLTLAFVIGLGVTQIVDAFMGEVAKEFVQSATVLRVIGLFIDLCLAGVFLLFGYLGRKQYRAAIITGMVLYALDGILLLLFQDYLGGAFHVWALISIWSGLKALGQLQATSKTVGSQTIESPA